METEFGGGREKEPSLNQTPEKSRAQIESEVKKLLDKKGSFMGSVELMEEANNWLARANQGLVSSKEAKICYTVIWDEIDRRRGDEEWRVIDKNLNDLANEKLEWEKMSDKDRKDWENRHELVCTKINSLKEIEKGEKGQTAEDIE